MWVLRKIDTLRWNEGWSILRQSQASLYSVSGGCVGLGYLRFWRHFSDAYSSWSSKSTRFSAYFHRISATPYVNRQKYYEVFTLFLKSLNFPRDENVLKLFSCSMCWNAISNFNLLNRYSNKNIVRSPCQNCKLH